MSVAKSSAIQSHWPSSLTNFEPGTMTVGQLRSLQSLRKATQIHAKDLHSDQQL